MKIRTLVAEKTGEHLLKQLPEADVRVGNWLGECGGTPLVLYANFWYELREESPGVLYLPQRGADKVSTDRRSKQFASV